jgi:hypothetical protein
MAPKAASDFFSGIQSLSRIDFRNNFQDHRQLSKHFLVSQAVIGNPEQVSRRGILEGFSQKQQKFYFGNCENNQRYLKKYYLDF